MQINFQVLISVQNLSFFLHQCKIKQNQDEIYDISPVFLHRALEKKIIFYKHISKIISILFGLPWADVKTTWVSFVSP